eukprot:c15415_g1_i1.p1 GENE.c15415_g1_i1~~c15415_g1_i1.p1  ORF type:complete len:423 (+),score=61.80 c15415_g1_i1:65-1333(+)
MQPVHRPWRPIRRMFLCLGGVGIVVARAVIMAALIGWNAVCWVIATVGRLLSCGLCCSRRASQSRSRVVVVGGGFAGAYAARRLEQYLAVTLIDDKDFWEYTPSVPRVLVEPEHADEIQIEHRQYLGGGETRICRCRVASLSEAAVTLENGEEVGYDYLILATGSTYQLPFKEESVVSATRGDALVEHAVRLRAAAEVLILGGGIVGVELAGEIAETYPGIRTTLVHSGDRLMSSSLLVPPSASAYVHAALHALGVRIVLNERVSQTPAGAFVGTSGAQYSGEVVFLCTGIRPNSALLRGSWIESAVDERGYVRVLDTLQVQGARHVFVAGDLTGMRVEKLAQTAEAMSEVVCTNVLRLDREQSALHTFRAGAAPIIVSIGRMDAVFIMEGYWISGLLPSLLKDFVERLVMMTYRWRQNMWM